MRKACFCYTTNTNYMGATVLSALQARRHVAVERADVMILLLGNDDAEAKPFAAICAQHGILFRRILPAEIEGAPVQCARHFLDRLIEPHYTDIVHVDGDTQIAGSLDPLLDAPLAPGRVLAVPDPMAVTVHHPNAAGHACRGYFRSIGISEERFDRYFNSGVFRVNRADAGPIGRECVRLYNKHAGRFRYGEQDAFNIAFGEVIDLMSFRWNFPVFFLNGGYETTIEPRLIHFMSNPRPWQGAFGPWGTAAHRVYGDLAAAHPELAGVLKPIRGLKAIKYMAQQRTKRLIESRAWTRPLVRERVARFEREAVV